METPDTVGQKNYKHEQIYEHIRDKIRRGEYQVGFQIPTEAAISQQFRMSRQTVGRALRALELEGLVSRKRGAGTFVTGVVQEDTRNNYRVTALIPDADDGVFFSRICMQMAFAAQKRGIGVSFSEALYGKKEMSLSQAEKICQELLKSRPSGVIFCPLKVPQELAQINSHIADTLAKAGIPLVLLDCDICSFPARSQFDVVGVDNRRGGFLLAAHLWDLGCRRIEFVAPYWNRPTVAARIAGYQEFLTHVGVAPDPSWIHHGDLSEPALIAEVMKKIDESGVEALICANDWTAAVLIRALTSNGTRVPQDVRVVGFDGINIADILPVSLTTFKQPVEELGAAAIDAMVERLEYPNRPARHIMLEGSLSIGESCGAHL
ncbi:MAG TPA: GntR family transcriptional regulator [Phycisphaerae bacterium]|nr:GntR family transcriptional regulator [Phycisphaerae bacterium]HOJ74143.1 GntR family transcriptional regulator [Phycisphaerae bacterium]HOM50737.1 GntR family transcriptional regulator [Phycisphaerae bacterium]HON68503.1 GntR family transcriptional regulator [Phycisphaerae bacterium]HOQ84678.1 GntR family transcriptional regulator [Phycisphaerae bacterium]